MQRWTDRGAAIIAQGDKIILMRRERGFGKNKQIYYTIPGGGREEGEKIEETAIREIKEERMKQEQAVQQVQQQSPNFVPYTGSEDYYFVNNQNINKTR